MLLDCTNCTISEIERILEREDKSLDMLYSVPSTLTITSVLVLQSTMIIVLNLVVLLAILTDHKMWAHPQYVCIAHMAVCDLVVGAFVSPFNIPFILYKEKAWSYGRAFCKAWLVVDNVVTSVMPFSVLLIMHDRYLFAIKGVAYYHPKTLKNCMKRIALVWTWCFLLYAPAIILWDTIQGYSNYEEEECTEEYNEETIPDAIMTLIEICVPTILLTICGFKLYTVYDSYSGQRGVIPKLGRDLFTGVGVYLLFWAPYAVTYILLMFVDFSSEQIVSESVYWVNIAGSMVHPFLFALASRRCLRKANWWLTKRRANKNGDENLAWVCDNVY